MPEAIWLVNLNIRRQNRLDHIRSFRREQKSSSAGAINDSKKMGLWKQIFLCLQTARSEVVRTYYSATFNIDLHVWKKENATSFLRYLKRLLSGILSGQNKLNFQRKKFLWKLVYGTRAKPIRLCPFMFSSLWNTTLLWCNSLLKTAELLW